MAMLMGYLSPDPVSNIRPVIYASPPTRKRTPNSPYSTGEFPSSSESRLEEMELEWRLRRERVDAMNHRFWVRLPLSSLSFPFLHPGHVIDVYV
jgi:hypothetical protein